MCTWCWAKNQDSGRVAPSSALHARRLLVPTVKHQGVGLTFVASLQFVNRSSLRHGSVVITQTCGLSHLIQYALQCWQGCVRIQGALPDDRKSACHCVC